MGGRRTDARPKAPTEELSGVYRGTRWTSPARDYIIGFLDDSSTIKGPVSPESNDTLVPGSTYRFFGNWTDHPRHGKAFSFVAFTLGLPHTREAVVQYLLRELRGTKSGIGHAKAHRLYDLYESDAVRKLREHPAEVAKAIDVDVEKCYTAASVLQVNAKTENAKIELVGILAGKGFPRTTIQDLIDRWGPKASAMVRRDAFLLLTGRFKGAGFSRCDNLYLSLGGDPAKLKRQTLCAWHGLNDNGAGNTWHDPDVAVKAINDRVDGVNTQPKKALKLGIRSGFLAKLRDDAGRLWLSDARNAKNEAEVAEHLSSLCSLAVANVWPKVTATRLSDHQRAELAAATAAPVGILAGTPGTGKTFTAAALIEGIVAQHGEQAVAICAPTGKAAVRLTESMQRYGIELRAGTIHRILQAMGNGHGGGDWDFRFGSEQPLPYKFIVVDESSMIDTDLMASLLRACRKGTHVLFLGDPYQLPPVGHGAPLRDFLAAGIPRGLLTEIRRNEGLIVDVCAAIKDGLSCGVDWRGAKAFDSNGNNLKVIGATSPAAVANELVSLYSSIVAQGKRDPIEDVQVLVPLNEKSDVSRTKLNPFIQNILNPNGVHGEGNRFRVGDKVICLSNDQYPSAVDPKAPPHIIYNGEQGRVSESTDAHTVLLFPDTGEGERLVKIPRKSEWETSFDLAYAITVHKSQGSEWPVVVVIGDEHGGRVVSREWWYTAVSRAKHRCLIFASYSLIGRQCKRVILGDRKTYLKELITASMEPQQERHDVDDSEEANEIQSRRSDLLPVHCSD